VSSWLVVLLVASLLGLGWLVALIRFFSTRTRHPRHRR